METFDSFGNKHTAETGGRKLHTGRHNWSGVCDSSDSIHREVFHIPCMDTGIPAWSSYTLNSTDSLAEFLDRDHNTDRNLQ